MKLPLGGHMGHRLGSKKCPLHHKRPLRSFLALIFNTVQKAFTLVPSVL